MKKNNQRLAQRNRIITGYSIIIVIALIHIFRVGQYLKGDLFTYYYSYASDTIIYIGVYFLLCIVDAYFPMSYPRAASDATYQVRPPGYILTLMTFFRKWYVKALFVFGITTIIEILQLFGVYIVGVTFDILNILMYAIGVMIAVLFDRLIFKRYIPFWDFENQKE
jgi:hypothetical protein